MTLTRCSLLPAIALLAACSSVGDYIPPEQDADQDSPDLSMQVADMSTPPDPRDMSSPMQDMPSPSLDMTAQADMRPMPPTLMATPKEEGIELVWSSVPGAERYDIKINGGDWQNVNQQTTYLDTQAPMGVATAATVMASDATRRQGVDLGVTDISAEAGALQTYEVRAHLPGAITTEPSDPITAARRTLITAYQWQYTNSIEAPSWQDLAGATQETAEDSGARDSGAPRYYRVILSSQDNSFESEYDEGYKLAAIKVTTGGAHTCALLNDGNVKCWGSNDVGQLGYGDTMTRGITPGDMPTPNVNLGGKVKDLYAGNYRTCALLESGEVKCWGNLYEATSAEPIGDDAGEMPPSAVELGSMPVKELAMGLSHQCALFQGGTIKCWGLNSEGQLGLGDTEPRGLNSGDLPTPDVQVGAQVLAVQAGIGNTCVLLSDNTVRCWGAMIGHGSLLENSTFGDEPGEMPPPPIQVSRPDTSPQRLFEGASSSSPCVLNVYSPTGLESITCWGANASGQLGLGTKENKGDSPNEMPGERTSTGGKAIREVYSTLGAICLLTQMQQVFCYGTGNLGQPTLGPGFLAEPHGDESSEKSPKLLDIGSPVQSLSLGVFQSCAVTTAGNVRCWGRGDTGALGHEDSTSIGNDMTTWPPPDVKLW